MNRIPIIMLTTVLLLSCGGSDTNKEESDHFNNKVLPDSTIEQLGSAEILSQIDRYLVSKAQLTPSTTGDGFREAIVTVKNKLQNITIQDAFLEVNILTADNKEYRTDFYTLENIEPGSVKTIKIPESSRGVKIRSHIVKLTSDSLTNGETVMVGEHYIKN